MRKITKKEHKCMPSDFETEMSDGKYLWEWKKCKICGKVAHT